MGGKPPRGRGTHQQGEIAAQLHLSPRTVGYHLSNAYGTLAVSSRAQLRHIPELLAPETEPPASPYR
ncbi:LuxR C-terminal-related transcriptional regulator [Streptomyces sp. NPDC090442]|uniref:LuxR C-terminal-related transcriptional regulator n=1 Tax=Streptomyces sp. NPDC090442 TaxID=3365962 RepID=UPI003813C4CF